MKGATLIAAGWASRRTVARTRRERAPAYRRLQIEPAQWDLLRHHAAVFHQFIVDALASAARLSRPDHPIRAPRRLLHRLRQAAADARDLTARGPNCAGFRYHVGLQAQYRLERSISGLDGNCVVCTPPRRHRARFAVVPRQPPAAARRVSAASMPADARESPRRAAKCDYRLHCVKTFHRKLRNAWACQTRATAPTKSATISSGARRHPNNPIRVARGGRITQQREPAPVPWNLHWRPNRLQKEFRRRPHGQRLSARDIEHPRRRRGLQRTQRVGLASRCQITLNAGTVSHRLAGKGPCAQYPPALRISDPRRSGEKQAPQPVLVGEILNPALPDRIARTAHRSRDIASREPPPRPRAARTIACRERDNPAPGISATVPQRGVHRPSQLDSPRSQTSARERVGHSGRRATCARSSRSF